MGASLRTSPRAFVDLGRGWRSCSSKCQHNRGGPGRKLSVKKRYAIFTSVRLFIWNRQLKPGYISVNPQFLTRIAHDKDQVRWKIEAVKVIFYAFPLDRRLEPLYSFSMATSILPLLETHFRANHQLSYLQTPHQSLLRRKQ